MRFLKKLVLFTILVLFAAAAVLGGRLLFNGYQIYRQVTEEVPLSEKVAEIRANPHYTALDDLPQIYKEAVVAVEDSRFYQHGGFDIISTARAFFINLREGELAEGGSTISQQLAKNMYFTQEKKFLRKAAELFVAFELERDYSKDEILELYLNTIYFGSGYYCVYDAAEGYFGKEPSQMTDYESTLLAGIPNAPSVYSLTNSPELGSHAAENGPGMHGGAGLHHAGAGGRDPCAGRGAAGGAVSAPGTDPGAEGRPQDAPADPPQAPTGRRMLRQTAAGPDRTQDAPADCGAFRPPHSPAGATGNMGSSPGRQNKPERR